MSDVRNPVHAPQCVEIRTRGDLHTELLAAVEELVAHVEATAHGWDA